MKSTFQYTTDQERTDLINSHSTLTLIEEQNITEGNFLIFSDNPSVDEKQIVYTQVPQTDFNAIQEQLKTADQKYRELDLSTASLADVQNAKIAQLNDMYNQTLNSGFQATIGTTQYIFGWSVNDKANLNATETAVDKGYATFPFNYADVHGNPVPLNAQADLAVIAQTATKFAFAQHQQILSLIGQVKQATTTDAVNAIQWSAATYA